MDDDSIFDLVKAGDVEGVRSRLSRGPDARRARDEAGVSVIMTAAYRRQPEILRLLADGRDDLDIFESAATGDVTRLSELIDKDGAQLEARSSDGFTPLQLAAFFGQYDATMLLVERGANVEAVSENGMQIRPIHAAAASGRTDTVRLLLEHGAEVDSRQHGEFTALHQAAHEGNAEMIEILMGFGADTGVRTHEGKTPADLAAEVGKADPRLQSHSSGPGPIDQRSTLDV